MSLEGFDDAPQQLTAEQIKRRKEELAKKEQTPEGRWKKNVAEITRLGLETLDGASPEELVKKLRELADSFEKGSK